MAQRDPYMRDRNISAAAGLQVVAGTGLGAGLGWAIAGGCTSPSTVIAVGAVLGPERGTVRISGRGRATAARATSRRQNFHWRTRPDQADQHHSSATGLRVVAGTGLGAGLGWAIAGWFHFTIDASIAVGAVLGFLIANLLISTYGGRATR